MCRENFERLWQRIAALTGKKVNLKFTLLYCISDGYFQTRTATAVADILIVSLAEIQMTINYWSFTINTDEICHSHLLTLAQILSLMIITKDKDTTAILPWVTLECCQSVVVF